MGTVRLTVCACIALVALVAMPATASAAKKRRTCTPKGSKTLAQNERVRVYRKRRGPDVPYVCAFKTRRSTALPNNEPGVDGYSRFALAGKFVAFGYYPACGVCVDEGNFVEVFDAVRRRGRSIKLDDDDDGKVTRVTDIEVTGRGAVAWISRDQRTATDVFVQKAERGVTTATLLDSGAGVALRSLARSGSTLYWTKDGAPRAATLGG